MKNLVWLVIAFALSACSARSDRLPEPEFVPDSVVWNADPELAPVLRPGYLRASHVAAADSIAALIGLATYEERLALIAEDSTNPWVVRANALKLLTERTPPPATALIAFSTAVRAREERLRATAVAGMARYLKVSPSIAVSILRTALQDPSPRVQARALELLTDRDVSVLRDYVKTARNAELRGVALDLIRTAEERGAPLLAKDTLGTLERTTASGVTISFHPTQRWPQWDAAVGELRVALPGKQPVVIAPNVEVVGGVIPAFMPPDSAVLVYEVNRQIHVRSLRDNSDRALIVGIAPRILPFSNEVLAAVEMPNKRTPTPTGTTMEYEIVRVPLFGDGPPRSLGLTTATAGQNVKGGYSPVRWMRVREEEGRFFLFGDAMKRVDLPTPFK